MNIKPWKKEKREEKKEGRQCVELYEDTEGGDILVESQAQVKKSTRVHDDPEDVTPDHRPALQ